MVVVFIVALVLVAPVGVGETAQLRQGRCLSSDVIR